MSRSQHERALYPIAYAIAALLIALPLLELALTVWPLRTGALMWRFGTFGLLTQALMLPTFGLFIAMLAAAMLDHRRVLLMLSVMAGLATLVLGAGLLMFVLDGAQARSVARPELRATVAVTAVRAAIAAVLYVLIWGWMSIVAFRTARRASATAGKQHRPAMSALLRSAPVAGPDVSRT